MERYDYEEAVRNDVAQLIMDEYISRLEAGDFDDLDELRDALSDDAMCNDSVTGNASGSYTFSTWEAEENLCHNWELMEEACAEFGYEPDFSKGAEWWDVIIRCMMAGRVIDDALDDCGIDEDDPRFGCNREDDE